MTERLPRGTPDTGSFKAFGDANMAGIRAERRAGKGKTPDTFRFVEALPRGRVSVGEKSQAAVTVCDSVRLGGLFRSTSAGALTAVSVCVSERLVAVSVLDSVRFGKLFRLSLVCVQAAGATRAGKYARGRRGFDAANKS